MHFQTMTEGKDNVLRLRSRVVVKAEPVEKPLRNKSVEVMEVIDLDQPSVLNLRSRVVVKSEPKVKPQKQRLNYPIDKPKLSVRREKKSKTTNSHHSIQTQIAERVSVGSVVYAKVRGFAPWPAEILESRPNETFKVVFFGSYDWRIVPRKHIFLFSDKSISKYGNLGTRHPALFAKAQAEAYAHWSSAN